MLLAHSPAGCHNFVIPAQAGIHHLQLKFRVQEMDSRLRGDDGISEDGDFCPESQQALKVN